MPWDRLPFLSLNQKVAAFQNKRLNSFHGKTTQIIVEMRTNPAVLNIPLPYSIMRTKRKSLRTVDKTN